MKNTVLYSRSRRRRAREAKNIRGHHDGLSSDDEESQTDISKFTMEKGGFYLYSLSVWSSKFDIPVPSLLKYNTIHTHRIYQEKA